MHDPPASSRVPSVASPSASSHAPSAQLLPQSRVYEARNFTVLDGPTNNGTIRTPPVHLERTPPPASPQEPFFHPPKCHKGAGGGEAESQLGPFQQLQQGAINALCAAQAIITEFSTEPLGPVTPMMDAQRRPRVSAINRVHSRASSSSYAEGKRGICMKRSQHQKQLLSSSSSPVLLAQRPSLCL